MDELLSIQSSPQVFPVSALGRDAAAPAREPVNPRFYVYMPPERLTLRRHRVPFAVGRGRRCPSPLSASACAP